MKKNFSLTQVLVFSGGLIGLIAGAVFSMMRFGWISFDASAGTGGAPSGDSLIGQIAFLVVFMLPFGLSLLALRLEQTSLQSAIWIGTGLLALAGSVGTFSAATLFVLPVPGLLVLIGGVIVYAGRDVTHSGLVIAAALGMLVIGAAAFLLLFTVESPACFSLVRAADGTEVWEPAPAGTESGSAQAGAGSSTGDQISWTCASDTIAFSEGWNSLGVWLLGVVSLGVIHSRKVLG